MDARVSEPTPDIMAPFPIPIADHHPQRRGVDHGGELTSSARLRNVGRVVNTTLKGTRRI
jgi:hypothetical protein